MDKIVKRRRTYFNKFLEASNGIRIAVVRDSKSFGGHLTATLAALAACFFLKCNYLEWAVVVLTCGLLWVTEMLNTAVETLFHGLDDETRNKWNACLDIAAGAVLTASTFAVVVGCLIFGNRILQMTG